ncbi:MAG: SUMF1/EgtB/PvdO family nonheme iron enzyme, partial [Planctomycetota bacterium]
KAFCERAGGHLSTISSQEENSLVQKLAREAGGSPWLGLSDEEVEGSWKWMTGERLAFTSWVPASPKGGRKENAAFLIKETGRWTSGQAFWVMPVACEWERAPAAAEQAPAEPARQQVDEGAPQDLERFNALVAKGDYAGAVRHAQAAKLEAAARVAGQLGKRAKAVRRGAEALVGKDAKLATSKGTHSGEVERVTDDGVALLIKKRLRGGQGVMETKMTVKWADLAPKDEGRLARSGGWKAEGAGAAIAEAILAISRKDEAAAKAALARAGDHPLAAHYRAKLEAGKTPAASAREPKPPPPTLTLDLGRGVRMELIYVKPGAFMMGNNSGPADQKPEHPVAIANGFYIGKYEVTQAQYRAVTGADPSHTKGPDRPVEKVSWLNAVEFCRQAAERTGHPFRLPTEAEWEYACRAGSTGKWCFGSNQAKLVDYAWLDESRPVGGKAPNAWGLYDMHGNVREWCSDRYDPGYYAVSPQRNPTGPPEGTDRIQRGGCAGRGIQETWSSGRVRDSQHISYPHIGFRAVVSAAPRASASARAAYDRAMSRAKMRVRLKNWKGAVEACEEALKALPGDPDATKLLAEARSHTGPARTLTVNLGRGVTMEMVYVKPGTFMMGNKSGPASQKPQHPVAITKGFYIGKHEVTQAQYKAVTGADPSRVKGPDRPVETVSWFDAAEFCKQAAERTRLPFRLPTEAEWEYACRAGSGGTWCFGNDEGKLLEYAYLGAGFGAPPDPVGERKPNAWGLYDMHGNVREWCSDWYAPDYYAKSPAKDPTGPAEGTARIQRGGCAGRGIPETWSSGRGGDSPRVRYPHIGLRAVVTVSRGN